MNRRDLLARSISGAIAGGALYSAQGALSLLHAASLDSNPVRGTGGEYKALVCVFLNGGNCSLNTITPRDNVRYARYAAMRGPLALAQNSLLALNPSVALPNGQAYGLHPNMSEVAALFNTGRAAVVANVGPLIEPLNRQQFRDGSRLVPPQLFSHSDQQVFWQTSRPDLSSKIGWGGRIADLVQQYNLNQTLSLSMTLGGDNIFQVGNGVQPYSVGNNGPERRAGYYDSGNANRRAAINALLGNSQSNVLEREFARIQTRAIANYDVVSAALAAAPTLSTVFPTDEPIVARLSAQLRMCARLLSARNSLDQRRQIFFVQMGGYDFHDRHLSDQANNLRALSRGLKAFYDATVEMGISEQVTAFTASDFGRTYTINGDGTDHGWGAEHFVIGGAVNGQRVYGDFPLMLSGGSDDAGWGQIIPKLAVDQYMATLGRWFGLSESNIDLIVPNLGRFGESGGRNLGFMASAAALP